MEITKEQAEAAKARIRARQEQRQREAREAEERYIRETDMVMDMVNRRGNPTADQGQDGRALIVLQAILAALILAFGALVWNLA